jgi:hypothetical protein
MSDENEIRDPEGLLKAYEKAKEDIVTLRAQLKELETERESFSEEAVQKWKNIAVQAQALKVLQEQGVKDGERILKRLDLSDVEFDEEAKTVTGLDTKLEEFKKEFPEIFDAKRRAGASSADIHDQKPAKQQLSGTEAQVARIFGH